MKIEISEVFVLHTDSISTEATPIPVGIAALDPYRTRPVPNVKLWRIPRLTDLVIAVLDKILLKQPKRSFLPDPMFEKVQKLDRFLTIS